MRFPMTTFNRLPFTTTNNQSLCPCNYEGYTKDDELLVLITLNIKDANIILDDDNTRIIKFSEENLTLVQWSDRTLYSDKKPRFNTKHTGEDARVILNLLFNRDMQGKRNFSDNPPNVQLTINCEDDDVYIRLLGIDSDDNNNIKLKFELQNGETIKEGENLNVKCTIDPSHYTQSFVINRILTPRSDNLWAFSNEFQMYVQENGFIIIFYYSTTNIKILKNVFITVDSEIYKVVNKMPKIFHPPGPWQSFGGRLEQQLMISQTTNLRIHFTAE